MVCNDVKRIAYFYLDGTLGEQKLNELQQHLQDCTDCDGRMVIHKRIREFIRRRMRGAASSQLRERITRLWRGSNSAQA